MNKIGTKDSLHICSGMEHQEQKSNVFEATKELLGRLKNIFWPNLSM